MAKPTTTSTTQASTPILSTLPPLELYEVYPTELKSGNILYSEQQSFETISVEGIDIASMEDIDNKPRFTLTPADKSDDEIYTQWMNDYSSHIDLEQIQWTKIFVAISKTIRKSTILQGYHPDGTERTLQEAKVLAYTAFGYDIK
jgi:hypothetical protein